MQLFWVKSVQNDPIFLRFLKQNELFNEQI